LSPDRAPSGTLYVVATPIGNLDDITLRALEVLRSVPLVAAEDTRLTRRLWARHGLATRLVSYHARSAREREAELLARLARGEDLALVTDAGTPLVSDPGEGVVAAWAAAGGRVVPVPGASAVLAALVASGIPAPRWSFEGFLPRRGRERRERLARIAGDERTSVLFEAPGRTAATLRDLASACGPERSAAVCRELTKLHEEIRRGGLGVLAEEAEAEPPRGEVTIVVAGSPAPAAASLAGGGRLTASEAPRAPAAAVAAARVRVQELVDAGLTRSAAARRVADETGLPRRELFRPARTG
jgi:16S rRNA (cytidine1402-2'-O)-methyltransferase